ncbi:hypothetical protein KS4_04960 [Poriferisphaera corsica]|uniref:Uncharacterized protein n=1 Tax=Poriferisphaera corsica TaxID=2528020 RepID=A0A517YQG2_9BACT|nr:hypothetical protein KS4_04960 [Poriferisphaera corsica]
MDFLSGYAAFKGSHVESRYGSDSLPYAAHRHGRFAAVAAVTLLFADQVPRVILSPASGVKLVTLPGAPLARLLRRICARADMRIGILSGINKGLVSG